MSFSFGFRLDLSSSVRMKVGLVDFDELVDADECVVQVLEVVGSSAGVLSLLLRVRL